MTQPRAARPPRLATACGYLGLVAVFQVVQVIAILSSWYSVDGQKQVRSFTDPLTDDGMSSGNAEMVFRVYLGFVAVIAASTVVFAVYTFLGHAVSRIMLAIAGPLVALICITQGTFTSALLGVIALTCVFQLWSADIRRWFTSPGDDPHEVTAVRTEEVAQPRAYAPQAPPKPPHDVVRTVALVTLIGGLVVAFGCGAYLVMYEVALDQLVRQQLESGMNWMDLTEAEIRDSFHQMAILSWVVLPLSLVAVAASAVVLRRRGQRR